VVLTTRFTATPTLANEAKLDSGAIEVKPIWACSPALRGDMFHRPIVRARGGIYLYRYSFKRWIPTTSGGILR